MMRVGEELIQVSQVPDTTRHTLLGDAVLCCAILFCAALRYGLVSAVQCRLSGDLATTSTLQQWARYVSTYLP